MRQKNINSWVKDDSIKVKKIRLSDFSTNFTNLKDLVLVDKHLELLQEWLEKIGTFVVTENVPNLNNFSSVPSLPNHPNFIPKNGQRFLLTAQSNGVENGWYSFTNGSLNLIIELSDEINTAINNLRSELSTDLTNAVSALEERDHEVAVIKETQNIDIQAFAGSLPSHTNYTIQENELVFLAGQTDLYERGFYLYDGTNLIKIENLRLKELASTSEKLSLLELEDGELSAEHFIHSGSTGNLSYLPDPARNNKLGLHLSTSGLTGQPPTIDGRVVFERKTGLAEIGFKDVVKITARGANFGNNATFAFPQLEKYFEVDTTYSLGNFTNGYYRHENAGSDILEAYIKVKETQPEGLVNNIEIRLFAGSQFTTDFFDFTFEKFSFADFVFADSRIDSPLTDASFNYLAKDFTATIDLEQSHHDGIQDFTLSVNNNEGSVNITQNDGTQNLIFEATPSVITDNYRLTLNINDKFGNAITRQVDLLRAGNYVDELVEFVPESTATTSTGSISSAGWAESAKELRGQGAFEYDGLFASGDVFNLGLVNSNLSTIRETFSVGFFNTWISAYIAVSNRSSRIYETGEQQGYLAIDSTSISVNMKIIITNSVNYLMNGIQRYNSAALPPFPSVLALGVHKAHSVDARNIWIKGDWIDRTI